MDQITYQISVMAIKYGIHGVTKRPDLTSSCGLAVLFLSTAAVGSSEWVKTFSKGGTLFSFRSPKGVVD